MPTNPDPKDTSGYVVVMGADAFGAETLPIQVDLINGIRVLRVDAEVQVNALLGQDNIADTWFFVGTSSDSTGVGAVGDTVTIDIKAGDVPSRFPAVNVVTTITAAMVSDPDPEIALAIQVVLDLNADITFKSLWKASKIKKNSTVHISAKFVGEFGERKNSGDFFVTASGTTVVLAAFNNIQRRSKSTGLTRDPNDPRFGVLGISGTVASTAEGLGRLYQDQPKNGGSPGMAVDGSVTPVVFEIMPDANDDIFVEELKFHGSGNGIQFGNFLNIAAITSGILIEIKSDDDLLTFNLIKLTEDFKNRFATGVNWILEIVAGTDHFLAVFKPGSSFPIRKAGTFENDDFIRVTIQDDLGAITSLEMTANGFRKEP